MIKADLAVINAAELATPCGSQPLSGKDTGNLKIIHNACIAAFQGKIVFTGTREEYQQNVLLTGDARVLDASGKTVIPGLVDSHTHLPFAGYRDEEFLLRISGASYEEIARRGGGIRSTVKTTRAASREDLVALSCARLDSMLLHGTTTCEAKSGYGLDPDEELKQLEALADVSTKHRITLIRTFLGAHTIPAEFEKKREAYVSILTDTMIPDVAERRLAEFCDIFCDEHGFTYEESKKILAAAKKFGLKIKTHADQFGSSGGSQLAAEFNAVSADHLENISDEDIRKLARSKVIGTLLPGSVFFLKKRKYAPARTMLDAGMALAIASDFNPGSSMTESMQMILQLSVFMMDLTVGEALTMATLNGAAALQRADAKGSLEPGKDADIVIMDIPNHLHCAYHFGINHCSDVIIGGKLCVEDRRLVS